MQQTTSHAVMLTSCWQVIEGLVVAAAACCMAAQGFKGFKGSGTPLEPQQPLSLVLAYCPAVTIQCAAAVSAHEGTPQCIFAVSARNWCVCLANPPTPPPAGSADAAVIPSGIGGFIACKALSKRNDDPATASRPWDRDRDGFVMGEGAGEGGTWCPVGLLWTLQGLFCITQSTEPHRMHGGCSSTSKHGL